MAKNIQHVVPNQDGGWSVKRAGSTKSPQKFHTQREAINYGRQISKNKEAELFIHRTDGSIRSCTSYGHDPCPPKDKR